MLKNLIQPTILLSYTTMGRHSKRQKISTKPVITSLVPPTRYDDAPATLTTYGTASSIMNGNTEEGGLKSLTYKSVNAFKLVEDLDLIKNSIISSSSVSSIIRITDEDYASSDLIKKLTEEVDTLKKNNNSRNTETDEIINKLNLGLDNELLKNKSISSQYNSQVVERYEQENKIKLKFSTSEYDVKKISNIGGITVDKFEDVKNIDLSAYEKKPASNDSKSGDSTQTSDSQGNSIPTSELMLNSGSTTAAGTQSSEPLTDSIPSVQTPAEPVPSPSVAETTTSSVNGA